MNFFSKIRNLIKRGLITLDRTDPTGQCSYMETVSSYESIKPYGFDSKPKQSDNSLVILLNLNGNESGKLGFEYDNKKRFSGETLAPGETVLYNPTRSDVYSIYKNSGEARHLCQKTVIGNSTVELLQQISDHLQENADMIQLDAEHFHSSILGATGIPNNAVAMLTIKANILAIKAKVDSIKGVV